MRHPIRPLRPLAGALALALLALAAQAPAQPDPAAFQRLSPYFDLVAVVNLVVEMETTTELTFDASQSAELLPILTLLQTSSGFTVEEAEAMLFTIEEEILTADQLLWLDEQLLGLAQGPRGQGPRGQGGQRPPQGQAPGGFAGNGPGDPQAREDFQRLQRGEPFNPFLRGRMAERLGELIALLQAKATPAGG